MSGLYIALFRTFQANCDGEAVACFNTQRVVELFSYLLLYRRRPHLRESLITMLWCNTPPKQAKKYLRQTLWQLQTSLHETVEMEGPRILHTDAAWIQINPQANIQLDVDAFEKAFSFSRGIPGRDLSTQQIEALQDAVELYQGDLLEGWYQDWCLFERERLQNIYLMLLDKLMRYCEAHNDCERGIQYGLRVLQQDPARERAYRSLMRLYYLRNNRTAALRHYDRCVNALRSELAVKPARSTVALYECIREDRPIDRFLPAEPVVPQTTVDESRPTLTELLDHFKHLQNVLHNTQQQVQKNIEAVEVRLNPRR